MIYAPNGREAVRITNFTLNLFGVNYYYNYTDFTRFASTRYLFFVKWNDSEAVDWANSNIKASIYYNGKLLRIYTPPKDKDKSGQYWSVFEIDKTGTRTAVDELSETAPVLQ